MDRILTCRVRPEQNGMTVQAVLKQEFSLSVRLIRNAKFRFGGIRVNGEPCRAVSRVRGGEEITVHIAETERDRILIPTQEDPDIRYEEEDLLFVYKPAGLVTHPSPGHYADSLANQVAGYYARQGLPFHFRPVGRLDRDTSGLLLVAKNAAAAQRMTWLREQGRFSRTYTALCRGIFKEKSGTVEQPIAGIPGILMKRRVSPEGQYARTRYRILGEYGGYSLAEVSLDTGRTHQIRVHMAWLGHPLLGDGLYGSGGEEWPGGRRMERAALHCRRLQGEKPFTGEPFSIEAELPADMAQFVPEMV